MNPTLAFVGHWMRSPIQTAALLPSSQRLADAIAHRVPAGTAPVVELGGGTGAITRALLRRGVTCRSLVVIEKNPALCGILRARLPGVRVVEGDVCALRTLLPDIGSAGTHTARAVVSGLGLRGMNARTQARICRGVVGLLAPDGVLVQFTYGLRPPLHPAVQADFGLVVERTDVVLLNLPPASVYVYRSRHRGDAGATSAVVPDREPREADGQERALCGGLADFAIPTLAGGR